VDAFVGSLRMAGNAGNSNVLNSGGLTVGRALAPDFLPTILFNPFGDSFTFSRRRRHPQAFLTETPAAAPRT
jgi:hypothetical protein